MSVDATIAANLMAVPDDLRWAVSKMIDLHNAGWTASGYHGWGGVDGKTQHVMVDFRRVKADA